MTYLKTIYNELDEQKILTYLVRTASVFLSIGILLSYTLWQSKRNFPLLPIIPLGYQSEVLDMILLPFFFFSLLLGAFSLKKRFLITALLFLLFWLILDQMRWQAWVYVYVLILIPFAFLKLASLAKQIHYFQIIMIGVYFWSGVHKLNMQFIEGPFFDMYSHFFSKVPFSSIAFLGYSIGIIEIATAVLLFFPKTRFYGMLIAIITHIVILIFLSPWFLNYNTVVYPWNVAMIIFVILLFSKSKKQIFVSIKQSVLVYGIIFLTWLAPGLNFLHFWDNYLAFSLYSGKVNYLFIQVPQADISYNGYSLKPYISKQENTFWLDAHAWSLGTLNVPMYAEKRVFTALIKKRCNNTNSPFITYTIKALNGKEISQSHLNCK